MLWAVNRQIHMAGNAALSVHVDHQFAAEVVKSVFDGKRDFRTSLPRLLNQPKSPRYMANKSAPAVYGDQLLLGSFIADFDSSQSSSKH
jgi:hypothetical protein